MLMLIMVLPAMARSSTHLAKEGPTFAVRRGGCDSDGDVTDVRKRGSRLGKPLRATLVFPVRGGDVESQAGVRQVDVFTHARNGTEKKGLTSLTHPLTHSLTQYASLSQDSMGQDGIYTGAHGAHREMGKTASTVQYSSAPSHPSRQIRSYSKILRSCRFLVFQNRD